ncbi:MAG TPA: hypothetical protein VMW36_01960 [Patescibacteria group bacterium]|nr:hypothetical protein [Patescibacteria group bacterium]
MGWSWEHDRFGSLMFSCPLQSWRDCLTEVLDEKNVVEELKTEWKRLWRERFDDRVRAEGIAKDDYSELFVERGTVILATRNFKLLSFRDVLERHGIIDVHKYVSPYPRVGGWGKFVRASIASQKAGKPVKRAASYVAEPKVKQHLKKGGRGWVHV